MISRILRARLPVACALTAAAALTLGGCGSTKKSGDRPAAAPASAAPSPVAVKGSLAISSPFIPKPVDKGMAAAYFVVRDSGSAGDHLDRVTAPGFAHEVQTHTTKNDRMIMVHGYDVPAGGTLTLARGGNHLMLMKLSRMPHVGDTVTLHLYFAKAGKIDVRTPVKPATYRPASPSGA